MGTALVGRWTSDPEDEDGIREFGQVTLEFSGDGELTYTIHQHDRDQKLFLTYVVLDGFIETNEPSSHGASGPHTR